MRRRNSRSALLKLDYVHDSLTDNRGVGSESTTQKNEYVGIIMRILLLGIEAIA